MVSPAPVTAAYARARALSARQVAPKQTAVTPHHLMRYFYYAGDVFVGERTASLAPPLLSRLLAAPHMRWNFHTKTCVRMAVTLLNVDHCATSTSPATSLSVSAPLLRHSSWTLRWHRCCRADPPTVPHAWLAALNTGAHIWVTLV
jgi:hypothetical protein